MKGLQTISKTAIFIVLVHFFLSCSMGKKEYSEYFMKKSAEAKYLFLEGKLSESLKHYQNLIKEEKDFVPARIMEIKCLYYLKQYEEMKYAVERTEKRVGKNNVILYWKAKYLKATGQIEGAVSILTGLADEDTDSFKVYYDLAQIYEEKKNFKEALKYYHLALALEPMILNVRLDLIQMYLKLGFKEKGQQKLKETESPSIYLKTDTIISKRIEELKEKLLD